MNAHSTGIGGSRRESRTNRLTKGTPPAESIHDQSARLQREKRLCAEARPADDLVPLHVDQPLIQNNKYGVPDIYGLAVTYGEHQLGAFAYQFSAATLREIAGNLSLEHPGRSRKDMVSAIVSHVTQGRYSANFGDTLASDKRATKAGGKHPASRLSARPKSEPLPSLIPIRHDLPLQKSDPYSPPNPAYLVLAYGRSQLARALQGYSVDSLKQTSAQFEAKFPGSKPTNRGQRASLIAYIVAQYDREQAN